jgi:hypothetical protein
MKYLFATLALLMGLFAAVQYNDPDGPLWMVLYGVPAIWALVAVIRPYWLAGTMPLALLGVCLFIGLILVVVLWPPEEEWWRTEVWWESEESREGMGLMIATGVLLAVLARAVSLHSKASGTRH